MQKCELVSRLIKAEDFDAIRDRLNAVDIPFYSPGAFVWQEKHYRSLMFFNEDKDSVFRALSELGADKYTHPTGEALSYTYGEIYALMFRKDAEEILDKIKDLSSMFFDRKIEVDRKIRHFILKIDHATGIIGEEFLNIKYYENIRLRDVIDEMKVFLGRTPFR